MRKKSAYTSAMVVPISPSAFFGLTEGSFTVPSYVCLLKFEHAPLASQRCSSNHPTSGAKAMKKVKMCPEVCEVVNQALTPQCGCRLMPAQGRKGSGLAAIPNVTKPQIVLVAGNLP
jgi:hypothetical protein